MARAYNPVKITPRGSSFQACANWKNNRVRLNFPTYEEAQVWAHEQEARMMRGEMPQAPEGSVARPSAREAHTLGEILDYTLKHRWLANGANGKPMRAQESRKIEAEQAVIALGGRDTLLSTLTYATIEAGLLAHQEKRGNSLATTNRRKCALNVMLKNALKLEWIDRLPVIEKKRETARRSFRVTPTLETEMLKWALSKGELEFYDWMVLGLYLGGRENQVLRIRHAESTAAPTDPYLDDGFAVFPPGETENKSTLMVCVPLRPITEEVFQRRAATATTPTARLFEKLHKERIDKLWNRMKDDLIDLPEVVEQQREGLKVGKDWVPHILRNEFCSRLGDVGFNVHEIMTFSGHTTASTCLRYVKPNRVQARARAMKAQGALFDSTLPGGEVPPFAPNANIVKLTPKPAVALANMLPADPSTMLEMLKSSGMLGDVLKMAVSGNQG